MKKIILISIFFFLIIPCYVGASTFFFDPIGKHVLEGEKFTIYLEIKPENDLVNAVEGSVGFDRDLLKVLEIKKTNSIINIWIKEPEVENGTINFSGIIPGGFNGVLRPLDKNVYPGILFGITFEVVGLGSGAVNIENIKAFQNDGLGTEAESSVVPFSLDADRPTNGQGKLWLWIILFISIIIMVAYYRKTKNEII